MLDVPLENHAIRFKRSFLQKSASVASLVGWKERFETYSGNFLKQASFVSYATDPDCIPHKLANEIGTEYNNGPENDLPPGYISAIRESSPSPFSNQDEVDNQKKVSFNQDFTALEDYLKKKLCVKKKGNIIQDAQSETIKVFEWLHELPQGDNLEEFLEAYGIPTEAIDIENLKIKLKTFIEEKLSGGVDGDVINDENHEENIPHWKRQMSDLENLVYDDNLEKWLESLDVPYFRPIPETKDEIRNYLKLQNIPERPSPTPSFPHGVQPYIQIPPPDNKELEIFTPKWKELVEKMRSVQNEDDLRTWLESLEVPNNVNKAKIAAEIKKYFRHEQFDNFKGKSIILQEHTFTKELWDKFADSSTLKKVGVIAGTTAVLGIIAVLSATLLSFAVPAAFATNPFFVEIFAQYFLQRQEVAFNLLNFHAQNAKPLSTAWAKQYVLWKYC